MAGLEPARAKSSTDFKSVVSTYSTTSADTFSMNCMGSIEKVLPIIALESLIISYLCLILLTKVAELIKSKGWAINNIDSVIVAERPKFLPHINEMKENISNVICLSKDLIGIKATTNETLGPEGREEGISCHSVALLEKIS